MRAVFLAAFLVIVVAAKPRCLFLHGIGQKGPTAVVPPAQRPSNPAYLKTDGHKPYWGPLIDSVSKVCESRFYFTDSDDRGWDNAELQTEYCSAISYFKADIVFSHSMANNVLSAAVANNVPGCTNLGLGANQIHWYGMQGPLRGTLAMRAADRLCSVPALTALFKKQCNPQGGYDSLAKTYVAKSGRGQYKCNGNDRTTTSTCTPLALIASERMLGSMCGYRPARTAAVSDYNIFDNPGAKAMAQVSNAGLTFLANLVHGQEPSAVDWDSSKMKYPSSGNDGMVGVGDCLLYTPGQAVLRAYTPNPSAFNYALFGNHADGTCRFGDRSGDPALQPIAWVLNMIRYSTTQKSPALVQLDEQVEETEDAEEETEVEDIEDAEEGAEQDETEFIETEIEEEELEEEEGAEDEEDEEEEEQEEEAEVENEAEF